MGLFDSAQFDPSSYQDDGGLIARLLAQLGTQGQYQPGAGMPPSPMDANAAAPQQQNAPIAVGDYQMPRIGSGFAPPQIDPQTGETVSPAPAAPMQAAPQPGANPIAAPAPQIAAPGLPQPYHSPGGFGGAMRGAMANITGGPLGMIGGAITGGMGMGRGTPRTSSRTP